MTQELYQQITELILMTLSLSTILVLLSLLLEFLLKHYDEELRSKKIKELNRKIKDLEERLETKTEIERIRYEHQKLIEEYNNDKKN